MTSRQSAPFTTLPATLLATLSALLLWACASPPQGSVACAPATPSSPARQVADPVHDRLPDPGDIPPLKFAQ